MKKIFCCPTLELFCCLPLCKTVLFVSSRAFLLSTPTFSLSSPVDTSEATWKKSYKMQQTYQPELSYLQTPRPKCLKYIVGVNARYIRAGGRSQNHYYRIPRILRTFSYNQQISQSRFAVRKVQTKKLVLRDFQNIGHLKVLNDTKLILDD